MLIAYKNLVFYLDFVDFSFVDSDTNYLKKLYIFPR